MSIQLSNIEIILYVSDVETSKEFYKKLFRMNPILDLSTISEFSITANFKIGLMSNNSIAKIVSKELPHPNEGNGIPRCELYLNVNNIESEYKNAINSGAKLLSPILDRDWGDRVCYFADPDGHIIAFAEKIK